jgi:ribosomal protein S18 acetylase RimI-like enzyme
VDSPICCLECIYKTRLLLICTRIKGLIFHLFSLRDNISCMNIEEFDTYRHNKEEVENLLSMASGDPSPKRLRQLLDEFYIQDNRSLFIALRNGKLIGIIGIEFTDKSHCVITHVAVIPDTRKQGIGRMLIEYVFKKSELMSLEAETDLDAIDFYLACGFSVKEIESRWSGARRFKCVKLINPA